MLLVNGIYVNNNINIFKNIITILQNGSIHKLVDKLNLSWCRLNDKWVIQEMT